MKFNTYESLISSVENLTYTEKFEKYFSPKTEITKQILESQKRDLGFTLYMLHRANLNEAINIGIENSRNIIETQKTIFQIPHTYIFGGLFLGALLLPIQATFLFLPIFFAILYFFSVRKILKIISSKISIFKTTRVFFDLSLETAKNLNEKFWEVQKYVDKSQPFSTKIFLFAFSQPFIFGHLHLFGRIPISTLVIYDFFIFLLAFGFFEKIIFFLCKIYYQLYFSILDKYPRYFNKNDQKNDFFMDLHEVGMDVIENVNDLKKKLDEFQNGNIHADIGKSLALSIGKLNDLLNLVITNDEFLENNSIFKEFIKNMLNEIIDKYLEIFEYFDKKINEIRQDSSVNEIDSRYKKFYTIVQNQNLENKIQELNAMRERINKLKVL